MSEAEVMLAAGGGVADEPDPPVAEAQQVRGGQPAAGHVIDNRLRHAGGGGIDGHQRDPAPAECREMLPGQVDRYDDDSVGPVPCGQRGQVWSRCCGVSTLQTIVS